MKHLAAALLAALALSTTAFAEDGGDDAHNGPCKADVEKLCPDVKPGGGRIAACMKAHKDELSDACKANLKKMKARHAQGGQDAGGKDAGGKDGGDNSAGDAAGQ